MRTHHENDANASWARESEYETMELERGTMLDPRAEARRLVNDPEHLRRKAAWIREQAKRGGPRAQTRLDRAGELELQAAALEPDSTLGGIEDA